MKCLIIFIILIQLNFFAKVSSQALPTMRRNHIESNNRTIEIMRYAKGAGIHNFMNEFIDPCDDFYSYSCGNWARINPALRTPKNGIFNVLSEAYGRRITEFLNRPKRSNESDMERKVKYFYESCLILNRTNYDNRAKLIGIMEEFGGMPALKGPEWKSEEFDWMRVIGEILRKYGKEIIIGIDVSSDLYNNKFNRLYIGQPKNRITSRIPEYYGFLIELESILGMNSSMARKTAKEILKFEQALAKGLSDPLDGVVFQDKCKKRLLDDMSRSYKPTMDFTSLITNWLGYPYQLPVYEYVETYLQNLKSLIENTTASTVANYMMWHLVQDFRMEPEATAEKQKQKCTKVTKRFFVPYLDNVVYRELLERNANLSSEVQELWLELKATFEETLLSKDSLWITPETREKALRKLSAMELEINSYEMENFEHIYADIIIGTDQYFDNLISIMEHRGRKYRDKVLSTPKLDNEDLLSFTPAYAAEFNRILMPVAFLQPRFLWDPVYPAALKYGSAGYAIAHEMAHGFDDNGREFDARGNLRNWWDEKSTRAFLVRKECLSQHYSEYKYDGSQMMRSNAQDENIADNVGIRVAFAAYEKWLAKQSSDVGTRRETLPFLRTLKPQQLFFVAVAQVWCTDVQSQMRKSISKVDVHVPEEIRVAGMVSNFQAFATYFQCSENQRMHPQRKCIMY